MIRNCSSNCKALLQSQTRLIRLFSTQALNSTEKSSKFQDEWNAAKPYESIPKLSKFQMIKRFAPGGKYYKVSLIDLHRLMREEFGDITAFPAMFGRPKMAMTYNVEDVEKLFRSEGQYPHRRTLETLSHYRQKIRPDIYKEHGGLFNEQGENWYKMRSLISPVMLQPKTVKLYVPQVEDIANEFLDMLMVKRDSNNEVPANFGDIINLWSLESIAYITLHQRLGLLKDNCQDSKAEELIKLIRKFFIQAYDFEVNPSIWRYYKTKAFKDLMTVYDGITNIILHYVDKAISEVNAKSSSEDHEESILEKLLKVDKKVAVIMCADSLLAGVDTTSSAATGILYCLAKNPDKQQKLREELMQILPNKTDRLSPTNMRNLPYLRAVIKEGIRLYPPAGGNLRTSDKDLVLSGYRIPKGTEVAMGTIMFYTDDKNFGKSKSFIPERWLKNNTDPECPHAKDSNPFAYLPFGFGARMCVGKRLAELEIEALVISIIRKYKIEWHHPDMKIKSVLVNVPDGDLKFRFTEI